MRNVHYGDDACRVVNSEDNSVVSDTNSPQIFVTSEFLTARRPGVIGQGQNPPIDSGE